MFVTAQVGSFATLEGLGALWVRLGPRMVRLVRKVRLCWFGADLCSPMCIFGNAHLNYILQQVQDLLITHASNLTVASSQYDIFVCSETLGSDLHQVSELLCRSWIYSCFVVSGQDASSPIDGSLCER